MEDTFDAIVVGAGVAGSTAAYRLAQQGLQVVLIERGPFPGSKNLSGGVLYGRVLHELIPNYWQEAPVERFINNLVLSFMTGDSSFNVDFKTQSFAQPPYNGISVLRSKFDRWLAGKAEEEGAMLVPGIHVDRLLQEEGRTVGVAAGEEEIRANVVIVAEGANSFLVQQAGLRGRLPTDEVALGVKELIGLPREVLEDRFHLAGEEGTAYNIVGFATGGVSGGGFLYTNKESLSVGLVMQVKDLVASKRKPSDLMEEFLAHPMIAPLVKGGKLLEYGAHLVMEGGLEMMPRLYTDGLVVVGDAAGLSINNGFVVRGMDLAIGSAVAAADAITEANARKDFSAQSLSAYQAKLDQSYVMADMRTYARAPQFLTTERLYHEYPAMLTDLMTQIYSHEAQPKKHLMPILMQSLKDSQISFFELTRDVLNGVRAL